ncbi:putative nucleic acid-binding protein [Okibacterium sp. HSC-33S16]|uniref:type II toxin-antitoxin system VapC family toxin n=1 Tax=Okibacterium sp. HSC-33S16 TaxID=2910965 RepID=UPI00209CD9B2|nr:type II toxin-antitoxin system VapC family toxin [Okibacterium sp. HSC-33S16]MCP2030422.1 putative nucleic acid-binding protein [Okibacterium sp. HSC-33S16]
MTRFVVDASVVLHLLHEKLSVAPAHSLLAPSLIRSQLLSLLHEAVARGELDPHDAMAQLARFSDLSIRLLGDSALRRRAWIVADELGWSSTYDAEYIALTQLQGDAFVTLENELAGRVAGVVELASVDDLLRP